MKIIKSLSLNSSKKVRKSSQIKYVIIHYTGMQSTRVSLKRLRNLSSKVSAHYLIDKRQSYKFSGNKRVATYWKIQ